MELRLRETAGTRGLKLLIILHLDKQFLEGNPQNCPLPVLENRNKLVRFLE